ncbi:hypothetical protein TNCV_3973431 [Trichonephila clavipes]|nr:hypothetical protein TNCV_3973431 [Trichonephila clavipes]
MVDPDFILMDAKRYHIELIWSMDFWKAVKIFCASPCLLPASLAHLLDCWGISLAQLFDEQDLACNILLWKGHVDLVYTFLLLRDFK